MDAKLREMMEGVVTRLLAMLDTAGAWQQPWREMYPGGLHRQVQNGVAYKGINQFMLGMTALDMGYADPRWGTGPTWRRVGGLIRKGEKHQARIVYWNFRHYCNECKHKGNSPCEAHPDSSYTKGFSRDSAVFNRAQVDIDLPDLAPLFPLEWEPYDRADAFVAATGIEVVHLAPNKAFYTSAKPDQVNVPPRESFTDAAGFYGTLFHELTHATGHADRTGRHDEKDRAGNALWRGAFGTPAYAAEELVAEIGAAFLAAALEVETDVHPEHASYVASWRKVLTDDPMVLYRAAKEATKAAAWLEDAAMSEGAEALAS